MKITPTITNRDSRSLERYLNDVAKEEMLTADEEVVIARKAREGDEAALDRLVRANLRFVVSVAKKYQHTQIPLGDLINEGNIGLVKAAQRFDETRGFKFISYAVWWIRQSINQSLSETARPIRLPGNKIAALRKVQEAVARGEQIYEREPTDQELADILEMSVDDYKDTVSSMVRSVSLDKPLTSDETGTLLDVMANPDGSQKQDEYITTSSIRTDISDLLSNLSDRERTVIEMLFGIGHDSSYSYSSIGEMLGVSAERVRQFKIGAIKKLTYHARTKKLQEYL